MLAIFIINILLIYFQCGNGGCQIELAQQLVVIMIGEKFIEKLNSSNEGEFSVLIHTQCSFSILKTYINDTELISSCEKVILWAMQQILSGFDLSLNVTKTPTLPTQPHPHCKFGEI